MKPKTFEKLMWIFSALTALGLGIVFKFIYDIKDWFSVFIFASISIVSIMIVYWILSRVDKIIVYFQTNREWRIENEKEKEVLFELIKNYNSDQNIPYDVRVHISKKDIIDSKEKSRKEELIGDINYKLKRIKELESEVENLTKLIDR